MGEGLGDLHLEHLPRDAGGVSRAHGEIHHPVALGAGHEFLGVFFGGTFDQDAAMLADQGLADGLHMGVQEGLKGLQSSEFDLVGGVVVQIRRWRTGSGAEDEAKGRIEIQILDQAHHFVEVVFALSRKAHNEV